jgi:hypothetical protein
MSRIPSLWPEIKVDTVTPVAILRVQAAELEKATRGILLAEVTTTASEKEETHQLVVIAPALNYQHELLVVSHRKGFVYPATVAWQQSLGLIELREVPSSGKLASNEMQLQRLIQEALSSEGVQSIISSLIARSNESQPVQAQPVAELESATAE